MTSTQQIETTEAEEELISGEGKEKEEEKTAAIIQLHRRFLSRFERVGEGLYISGKILLPSFWDCF